MHAHVTQIRGEGCVNSPPRPEVARTRDRPTFIPNIMEFKIVIVLPIATHLLHYISVPKFESGFLNRDAEKGLSISKFGMFSKSAARHLFMFLPL